MERMTDMNGANRDTYKILSRYYDLEFDAFESDIDMYRQFAVSAGGPVLVRLTPERRRFESCPPQLPLP